MAGKEHSDEAKFALIATKSFKSYDEMYKVVDFLNKTLKDKKTIFGLTKNKSNDTMSISVYEI
ncbi:MAG: YpmA family protein [Eubacteriales bacterium]|nr:YpmA family protein [Desulfotomaculaceae bacterium]MDD4422917.1 YpmA family protein [Eubacteriales bacterium]